MVHRVYSVITPGAMPRKKLTNPPRYAYANTLSTLIICSVYIEWKKATREANHKRYWQASCTRSYTSNALCNSIVVTLWRCPKLMDVYTPILCVPIRPLSSDSLKNLTLRMHFLQESPSSRDSWATFHVASQHSRNLIFDFIESRSK